MSLLEIENLKTCFHTEEGPAHAVDGISFSLHEGETYALVGESGSGKSVTALSMMQLLPPSVGYIANGNIRFCGQDIIPLSAAQMRNIRGNEISMIFQEPMTALNPVFTIGTQISEVLRLHQNRNRKEAKTQSIHWLDRVGIPEPRMRFNHYPHELSGGMQQRVMIAMALACKPKLLIADEPTTALDVTIQSQILSLISDLQEETGTAILLITHDLGVVRENADRVGVLYAGKLVEEATNDELFDHPSHPYTELLMRALPSQTNRKQKLNTIDGLVPKATQQIAGCRFANRCPVSLEHCTHTTPPIFTLRDNHFAACHLFANRTKRSAIGLHTETTPHRAPTPQTVQLATTDLKIHFPLKRPLWGKTQEFIKAVDGVSIQLYQGETLALEGESGCGKTTVGKSLVQLHPPTAGTIYFKNRNLAPLNKKEMKALRQNIQFVFQDPFSSLDPRQPVGEIVIEGMQVHGIGASREEQITKAEHLLEKVGLDSKMMDRYPHEFSGGQRQRIVLARALSTQPKVLICDEATSALDVSVQAQILNLLKDLQNDLNLSYLFITHDLSVVQYLADRVAVMYLGRVVEEGTTREIFGSPRHPYTRALLSAAPQVFNDGHPQKIILKGDVPSPVHPPQGCPFHTRCPDAMPECRQAYPDSVASSPTRSCRCILYQA